MIYQLSPPRSGSTLMWQILNELYGGEVIKTHKKVLDVNAIVFSSVRDFRDACISYMRVSNVDIHNLNKDVIDKFGGRYLKAIRNFDSTFNRLNHKYLIKYEDFYNDYDKLFDLIEIGLEIKVDSKRRDNIKQKFSFDANMKVSKKFDKFANEWDKKTKIHGKHLDKGEVGIWKLFIKENLKKYYNNLFEFELKKYGYKD
jgi:hypothetical protein